LLLDEVVRKINVYLERCIAHGNLTLEKLSKIEERLTEEFKLRHFNDLKQGGFLQFLLNTEEIKKVILTYHSKEFSGEFFSLVIVMCMIIKDTWEMVSFVLCVKAKWCQNGFEILNTRMTVCYFQC